MKLRNFLWGGLAIAALAFAGFAGWLTMLPSPPAVAAAPPISDAENEATLAALKPKRARPVIAIVGINDATETTDYLMTYGILRRADIADVTLLATQPGPVSLYPALKVEPQATIAEFDAKNPQGADYVVVPAMSRDDHPAVMAWLKAQAAKGAMIVSVCAGAKVIAAAGLLDGKRATTHWYYLGELRKKHPSIQYVPDRRIVVDRGVATTTGITASMPMMLTLIEAIAGRAKAEEVARGLGIESWDARHTSAAFRFTRTFALTALTNLLPFWRHETLGLDLTPGIDEVSLALVVDAWSRTYRTKLTTFSRSGGPVETRGGLRLIADRAGAAMSAGQWLPPLGDAPPARLLDATLARIGTRYGAKTSDFVAMQLEYPRLSTPQ